MRTTYEIITTAKDGGMPTHEECYWAMLALEAASTLYNNTLLRELMKEPRSKEVFRKMHAETIHMMWHALMNKTPKEWLGPDEDPSNPDYQRRRKVALYFVMCDNLDCENRTGPHSVKRAAIAAWNRRADGWIPVSEQPKEKGVYRVKGYYPERSSEACEKIALWNGVVWIESIWFNWPQNNRLNPQPTHWMPLPQPPSEGERG